MPWWLAPAIAGGSRIAGELFGGGRDASPELSRLIQQIEGMMEEGLPEQEIGRISAPYIRLRKGIEQSYARRPGSSAKEHAIIQRQATTPQAQAIGGAQTRYRTGLLNTLAQLQMGAERFRQPTDWGRILGGAGAGFGQAYAEEDEFNQLMELLEGIMGGGGGGLPMTEYGGGVG